MIQLYISKKNICLEGRYFLLPLLSYELIYKTKYHTFVWKREPMVLFLWSDAMKYVTQLMINEYGIKRLGFDFMGYSLQKGDIYTYHHLIIPRRHNGPMTVENGAILCGKSSHPYLHLIEYYDYDRFLAITSEMIDQNIKGHLDVDNIRYIHDILEGFEKEYSGVRNKKGKEIIKEEYVKRLELK